MRLCACGCGKPTPLAKRTRPHLGHVKGQPLPYLRGHNRLTGKPMPEEMRRKIAAKLKGHPVSAEARAKMSRRGPLSHNWRGGRVLDKHGYVTVWIGPDHPHADMRNVQECVREHRLVMAEHIGRSLLPDEVVHHQNGDKTDNRIENLRLFSSTAEHTAHHHAERPGFNASSRMA
jgi:HNH endonuclease